MQRSTQALNLGVLLVCSAIVCAVLPGCSDELDPKQPEGAYLMFRQALMQGNADAVWDRLDAPTKAVFDGRAGALAVMGEDIIRFLPSVDQQLARRQSGVELLGKENVATGRDLFAVLFVPDEVKVTPEMEVGTQVSSVELSDAEDEAIVVTNSGQQYRLVLGEDEQWRISSWRELAVARTKWILDNQSALKQTVEDLVVEEREEIERIIDFLIKESEARPSPSQ